MRPAPAPPRNALYPPAISRLLDVRSEGAQLHFIWVDVSLVGQNLSSRLLSVAGIVEGAE